MVRSIDSDSDECSSLAWMSSNGGIGVDKSRQRSTSLKSIIIVIFVIDEAFLTRPGLCAFLLIVILLFAVIIVISLRLSALSIDALWLLIISCVSVVCCHCLDIVSMMPSSVCLILARRVSCERFSRFELKATITTIMGLGRGPLSEDLQSGTTHHIFDF